MLETRCTFTWYIFWARSWYFLSLRTKNNSIVDFVFAYFALYYYKALNRCHLSHSSVLARAFVVQIKFRTVFMVLDWALRTSICKNFYACSLAKLGQLSSVVWSAFIAQTFAFIYGNRSRSTIDDKILFLGL